MIRIMVISLVAMLLTFNYSFNVLDLGGHVSIVLTMIAWVVVGFITAKLTEVG